MRYRESHGHYDARAGELDGSGYWRCLNHLVAAEMQQLTVRLNEIRFVCNVSGV